MTIESNTSIGVVGYNIMVVSNHLRVPSMTLNCSYLYLYCRHGKSPWPDDGMSRNSRVKFTNTDALVIKFLGIFPRGGYTNGISSMKSNSMCVLRLHVV